MRALLGHIALWLSHSNRVRWPSGLRRQVKVTLTSNSWSRKLGVSSNLTLINHSFFDGLLLFEFSAVATTPERGWGFFFAFYSVVVSLIVHEHRLRCITL